MSRIKLTKEEKNKYAEMKENGASWGYISALINEEFGTSFIDRDSRSLIRSTLERRSKSAPEDVQNVEKDVLNESAADSEGADIAEAKKAKIDTTQSGYIIRYGKGLKKSVEISEESLQDLLSLYCIGKLTQEQVAMKKNLTRRELQAILNACDVVKSSISVTPRQLDTMSKEDIAEHYRTQKKKYAMTQFEKLKHKDIEDRIKKMDRKEYWTNLMLQSIDSLKIEPLHLKPCQWSKKKDAVYNVYLTDVHCGLEVKSIFGEYNMDSVTEGLEKIANHLINEIPHGSVVNICELGDTIHGIIHGSTKAQSAPAVASTTHIIKEYSRFLTSLTEYFYVNFTKVNGSHSSVEKTKTDRTDPENFGVAIYDLLKFFLKDVKNLEFIDSIDGLNIGIVKMFDYSTLLIHGDNTGMAKLRDADRLFREFNVKEINAGHIHHRKVEDYNGLSIFYNEPFCSTDQYAANMLLSTQRGVRIVEYTALGRGKEWLYAII